MNHPIRHGGGFTLIELMVSMALGSILLLAAASMLGASGDSYERIGGGVHAEREARALITQLTADLASATFHKDGVFEKSSALWSGDRIGFLSLQPEVAQSDAGRIGDLCAVNYYIKDLTIDGKKVRCLMRGFRESKDTFEVLLNLSVKPGALTALFAENSPGDSIVGEDEPVAFGVVEFEARPKSRDASGKWIDWIPNALIAPDALDARLVIVRRSLAARLRTTADWDGSYLLGAPADVVSNKDLEVYSAMIRFGNHEEP